MLYDLLYSFHLIFCYFHYLFCLQESCVCVCFDSIVCAKISNKTIERKIDGRHNWFLVLFIL